MAFGPFLFQAIGFGLTDARDMLETPWVETPVAGGPDRLQWVGGKASTKTISGVLFAEFGGQASLEGIKAAAENGIALPLVSLGDFPFNIFGMWAVTRVSEDRSFFDRRGRALRNAYEISMIKKPPAGVGAGGVRGILTSLVL